METEGRYHEVWPLGRSRVEEGAFDQEDEMVADVLISSDTHLTEPHDLFTSRLPKRLRDRAARIDYIVDEVEGELMQVTTFGKDISRAHYVIPPQYVFSRPHAVDWDAADHD